jgi:type IV pilus assembly protein PilY1
MNLSPRRSGSSPGFLGKLLYTSVAVWGLGLASTPVQATSIAIDSAPLIVQPTLPPNIVLMLDDSGSMAWDYMPDACYMNGVTCSGTNNGTTPSGNGTDNITGVNNDAMINANNNGVYYNPAITYTPPYNADGTQYPNATSLTSAWTDGFSQPSSADLTNYSTSDVVGESDYGGYTLNYSYSQSAPDTSTTNTFSQSSISQNSCNSYYSADNGFGGATWKQTGTSRGTAIGTCTFTYHPSKTYNYFQYSTGSAAGPYTDHYVAATDCGGLANCVVASDTSGTAAPSGVAAGQNIANWFAYYHTRILMAKSGLTRAFVNLNTTYRVGFGSINGNATTDITNTGLYTTLNGTNIAEAQPFGDGSAGTQKANFWKWIIDIKAQNGTRLRSALDGVGQYYQTQQPWLSDPTSAASTTNTELACRQSYTILTTDGFWNDNFSPPSSNTGEGLADDISGPTITGPNNQTYTYTVAAPYADSSTSSVTTSSYAVCSEYINSTTTATFMTSGTHSGQCKVVSGGNTRYKSPCNSGDTFNSSAQTCTATTLNGTTYSNTLADVAMYYWENDLRPNTNNEVPVNSEDPAFWQHMTTFTMGLGFTPVGIQPSTATIANIFNWANGGSSISNFSWPQPASNSIYNIADLAHAAVNGHGGFYSATSPQAFASGLEDALNRAASRVGTGSSLAANSTQLQSGSVAYQASYWTTTWKGDVQAFAIDPNTGAFATTATWSAEAQLPAAASRTIYTYNPISATYLSFAVSSSGTLPALSTAQNTALSATVNSVSNETNMINYLRGDSSQEAAHNGPYRTRSTPLGDIVDSQPVYVGSPDPNQFYQETFTGITGTSSYASYASTNASRQAEVYVAANDGMLHAFNASTGVETYAYLPGAVITSGTAGTSALTGLADPNYGAGLAHQYFNDGQLTVADAYFNSAWHTVLIGTTGRGLAKAVYALDITNPSSIQFLWERSASDGLAGSTYIGQMTGQPIVAQTADGTWSVLMGNGYNSAAGKAALLQFNLADGTLNVHTTTDSTGLAAPAVWMSPAGNGISTVAYAGDADGHVWSFQLNTSAGTTLTATPTSAGTLIYQAEDANNNAQPITAGMLIGEDPSTGNVWVFFGTGQYLSSSDLTNLNTQTWYGLIVQTTNSTSYPAISSSMTRSNLAQRSITNEQAASGTTLAVRTITTLADGTSMAGKSGWYIDLTSPVSGAQGERMVTPNQFEGGLLLGTTRIPEASDACNPSGTGWIMAVNPFTGTNPTQAFFDANGDGVINSSDTVNGTPVAGLGFSSIPNNPIFVGSSMLTSFDNGSKTSNQTRPSSGVPTRVSWRELTGQ